MFRPKTLIDSILLLILLGALVIGWRKGLVRQLASLVSWAEGYEVEALPDAVSITNALGEVNQTFTQHENQVTVVTRLLIRNGLYPADEYESLRRLKTAAKKAYDQRIVLKRKQ